MKLEPTSTKLEPTATDELRRLLDERNVSWEPDDHHTTHVTVLAPNVLIVEGGEHDDMRIATNEGLAVVVTRLTPEQAIEATLGRETCELTDNGPWGYPYVCSACGASFDADVNGGDFNFCPNCGAKLVTQ